MGYPLFQEKKHTLDATKVQVVASRMIRQGMRFLISMRLEAMNPRSKSQHENHASTVQYFRQDGFRWDIPRIRGKTCRKNLSQGMVSRQDIPLNQPMGVPGGFGFLGVSPMVCETS